MRKEIESIIESLELKQWYYNISTDGSGDTTI
jgi:hypothetical protein